MQNELTKDNAMLLAAGFATVSQITNHSQISCCLKGLCYSWVNPCDM